jgi:hypothetical protein
LAPTQAIAPAVVPSPSPAVTPHPTSTPLRSPTPDRAQVLAQLGQPVTLAEAQARLPFQILVPDDSTLGAPDAVYLDTIRPGGGVTLVYEPRANLPASPTTGLGLLLTEFQGSFEAPLIQKGLAPGTTVTPVTVSGEQGYWMAGELHFFIYRDANGTIQNENVRLAGNTLIWTRGALTLRMESALSMAEALRIAESLR